MVEQRTHKPRVPRSIRGTATIFQAVTRHSHSGLRPAVLGLCYFLAAVDRVPRRPPPQTLRLMVCTPQHHRDRFPPAQLLYPIDIDTRLNEPGRKPDSMLAILWDTTLAPGFHPAMATTPRSSNSPCLKRPIRGDRDSVRCSGTVSDARSETMSSST